MPDLLQGPEQGAARGGNDKLVIQVTQRHNCYMKTDPGKHKCRGPFHTHSPLPAPVQRRPGLSTEWTAPMFSHLARYTGGPKDDPSGGG